MIHLVGPGGAGKTSVGAALAEQIGMRFVDLDAGFAARHGSISAYLHTYSYAAYAEQNVGVYLDLVGERPGPDIVALSSGFMTYPDGVHPDYPAVRELVASSPSTFVLLPSLDVEACVGEIVRRQMRRPFARSVEREEQVIRERFFTYVQLSARKVETMRPVEVVVADLIAVLAAQEGAAADDARARCRARLASGGW